MTLWAALKESKGRNIKYDAGGWNIYIFMDRLDDYPLLEQLIKLDPKIAHSDNWVVVDG